MNKLISSLLVILAALILVFPVIYLQIQNSELKTQTTQLENQIGELENQTSELEDQIYDLEEQIYWIKLSYAREVKITKVESEQTGGCLFGISFDVHVTIHNYGVNDADYLYVDMSHDGSDSSVDDLYVGLIKAGDTKTVTVSGWRGHRDSSEIYVILYFQHSPFVAEPVDSARLS